MTLIEVCEALDMIGLCKIICKVTRNEQIGFVCWMCRLAPDSACIPLKSSMGALEDKQYMRIPSMYHQMW